MAREPNPEALALWRDLSEAAQSVLCECPCLQVAFTRQHVAVGALVDAGLIRHSRDGMLWNLTPAGSKCLRAALLAGDVEAA